MAEYPIQGTLPGRAYQTVEAVTGRVFDDGRCERWMPVLDGAERIGVIRVTIRTDDAQAMADAEYLAGIVALIIVSKGPYSDSLSRLMRTGPMTVSAEIQWRLMPPLTFANDQVVIGAALEPAYRLGGDTFDYALAGDTVHLAVFDAMGHDTAAGLTSALAVAACRNARLQGAGLVETGQRIEDELVEQAGGRFVTAALAELNIRTGFLSWVLYGHPEPVVLRGGRKVRELKCSPGTPLGTDLEIVPEVCTVQLEPGDRLLLLRRHHRGAGPGQARVRVPAVRGLHRPQHADGMAVPETLRRLIHSILGHHDGRLDDDATVLLLEWHGPHGVPRGDMAPIKSP